MNNVIPLQNSPERVSLLPIAPGVDFATALSLRRMATSTGATPAYLLAPEVSALLFYMPDQRHHMLFATLWNTGMRIGEARMLTMEVYTRVFALDMAATLAVPFTGDGRDAAEILRTLPPLR